MMWIRCVEYLLSNCIGLVEGLETIKEIYIDLFTFALEICDSIPEQSEYVDYYESAINELSGLNEYGIVCRALHRFIELILGIQLDIEDIDDIISTNEGLYYYYTLLNKIFYYEQKHAFHPATCPRHINIRIARRASGKVTYNGVEALRRLRNLAKSVMMGIEYKISSISYKIKRHRNPPDFDNPPPIQFTLLSKEFLTSTFSTDPKTGKTRTILRIPINDLDSLWYDVFMSIYEAIYSIYGRQSPRY